MSRMSHQSRKRSRSACKPCFRFFGVQRIENRAAIVVISLMLCLVAAIATSYTVGTAQASGGPTTPTHPGKQPLCDNTGMPACPEPAITTQWVTIRAELPSAVAAAISQSGMFQSVETRMGHLTLDSPALVHLLNSVGGSDYWTHDHWLASAATDAGQRVGIFDYVYDRARHRIRFAVFGSLRPSDLRYGQVFPYTSANIAVQRLSAERGLGAKLGVQPILVFFPPDPAILGPDSGRPQRTWTGGGEYPSDPMRLVVGSDGHNYFVGKDGHVHDASALPVARLTF
jgi:hypothetical protein